MVVGWVLLAGGGYLLQVKLYSPAAAGSTPLSMVVSVIWICIHTV